MISCDLCKITDKDKIISPKPKRVQERNDCEYIFEGDFCDHCWDITLKRIKNLLTEDPK